MQCLYCKKRLGLFASKKRPFCSELHEVAYQDEQSGLAMRRVMDPLFTVPVKSPPLRAMPQQKASPAEGGSETVPLLPAPDPAWCNFYFKQPHPEAIPPDLAATDVPLEVEPSAAGPVQLPSTSGSVIALDPDSVTLDSVTLGSAPLDPATAPAARIVAEGNPRIVSYRLHPRLQQSKPTAVAETGALAAAIGPSPFGCEPSAVQSGLGMNENLAALSGITTPGMAAPGIKAALAPLVSRAGGRPLSPDPASWPHGGIALAAEQEPVLASSSDPQPLPLRYPLANIAIAPEVFEAPAELTASRWSAVRPAKPESEAENGVQPESLVHLRPAREAKSQMERGAPAAPVRWQLAFVAAKPPRFSPARLPQDTRTEPFRWPQALPVLPSISFVKARIQPAAPAPASVELRGVGLAGRRLRPEPRELSKARVFSPILRSPHHAVGRSPLGTRECSAAPGEVDPLRVVRAGSPGNISHPPPPVRTPAMPARAERLAPPGILARIAPAAHDHRQQGFRASGVTDLQRFHAAAHIQIREPELRNSIPSDLPVPSTSLPWRGVRMVPEIHLGATPVPLRPSLQTPGVR